MVSLNRLVAALTAISLLRGSLAESIDPKELAKVAKEFKTAGIVPDVLPSFKPSALAYLTFAYPNGTSETIKSPGLRIGRDGKPSVPS